MSIKHNYYRKLCSLKKDPQAILLVKLNKTFRNSQVLLDTIVCSFFARCWGIDVGKDCCYYGKTFFQRCPDSTIKIGSNCQFRSVYWSNLIGVNRACGISTHRTGAGVIIGDGCGFSGTIIAAAKRIMIGDNVFCGANTTITDFDWHGLLPHERLEGGQKYSEPILIENNVWLGLNVLILKGVHIGENTVVGANSVVTSSLPSNVIAAGNPARIIRALNRN